MPTHFSLYEPREDSYLLAEQVRKCARGKVLDVGCGSGIQAMAAAKQRRVKSVLAADIQPGVIDHCRKTIRHPKISFRVSDLFAKIPEKFDTIIFNPPYLPDDALVKDIALDGGKKGSELLERFLREAPEHLMVNGQLLIVFSTRTKPAQVHAAITASLLEYRELARERYFFEELVVYQLWKAKPRSLLEQRGVRNIQLFTHGHRGFIVTGLLGRKIIAAKFQRPDSPAKGTVAREAKVLKQLNRYGIGPKLISSGKDFFIYQFIEGTFVEEWVAKQRKPTIVKMLRQVLQQMRTLDVLKVTKQEMHHPHKHIIVDRKGKPWLVDFERAKETKRPKNVTQFCQYLRSKNFNALLRTRGLRITPAAITAAAQAYAQEMGNAQLVAVRELIR